MVDWPAATVLVVAIPAAATLLLKFLSPNGGTKTDVAVLKSEHKGLRQSVENLKLDMNKNFDEIRKQLAGMSK